jgi:integrase
MALTVWMDRWKERAAKERQWKAKMLADVEFKLGYVKPFLGAFALADVLPDHVDHMIDELGRDLADNTVRQIRNYLYQVFEAAVKRRYITYNPVIKPERRKRPKQKETQRLSAPQAARLIRAAVASFYALAWWLVVVLGMRAGEICGLRWGDVDLERCEIFIQIQQTDVKGVVTQDLPKNDKTRKVAFPRAFVPLFHAQRQAVVHRAAQGLKKGYWQEHGLVFPGRAGRPMNPTSLRHMLKDLTDACKLPPVTTHNLRHTAAKFYTDIATPHDVKQAILGHTLDITGHYGPPDPDAQRPWVERVYHMLAGEVEKLVSQAS